MFFEARITNCVTLHHLQCLVRSQYRQLPSCPRRGGRRPGWREQRAVSSVACSARSEMVWAMLSQGGGLTALPWALLFVPFGDGERNAEFVLRGRRTERGRPRPQVPAFTQRHSARMGLAAGSCSALSADGGVRVPRHQPSTNCQRSNNRFQA